MKATLLGGRWSQAKAYTSYREGRGGLKIVFFAYVLSGRPQIIHLRKKFEGLGRKRILKSLSGVGAFFVSFFVDFIGTRSFLVKEKKQKVRI